MRTGYKVVERPDTEEQNSCGGPLLYGSDAVVDPGAPDSAVSSMYEGGIQLSMHGG